MTTARTSPGVVQGVSASGRARHRPQVERYGPELPCQNGAERLRCSECGSRDTDFVVTGYGGLPREERR